MEGRALDRKAVVAYKRYLVGEGYKASSVNSMLAAVNALLSYLGLPDCRVRLLKIQRQAFRDRSRELQKADYLRLLETARSRKKPRAEALLQTLCGVGIRVSELPFITKEAVLEGRAAIDVYKRQELDKSQAATVNAEKFMGIVRKHLAFEELTPTLLRRCV